MNEQRARIGEDLAGLLQGELRCDPLTCSMYASDGSLYQIEPLGVVYPRSREDVITIATYAGEQKIPLIPRGAGTGLAGESLGRGLIIDFSRHMRHIEKLDAETVRVQPGVVCQQLNRTLRQYGRYFPPDPSGASVTTIGSMLALDAAGSHSVRVGSTRDHVRSIELVLPGGICCEMGSELIPDSSADLLTDATLAPVAGGLEDLATSLVTSHTDRLNGSQGEVTKQRLLQQLAQILARNASLIAERQPPMPRNRCGYFLRGVLQGNRLDMPRFLVGSEGTLALFTSATLHTARLPAHRGVVLLLFAQLEAAVRAVQAIAPLQPSACDLLDRRLISLAREADPRFEQMIPQAAEAALIVEQTGFSTQQTRDRIRRVVDSLKSLPNLSVLTHEAYTQQDVDFLWSLPEKVVPMLTRLQGQTRPLPFVEDVAVPPESLLEFLVSAQNIFQKHRVIASLYAHAAAGQLHMRPFLAPPTPETAPLLQELAQDLYDAVFQVGGTISGEHGTGLSRSAFIRQQYGPLFDVFRQIKHLFDPQHLLNPGKVVTDDDQLIIRDLRPSLTPPSTSLWTDPAAAATHAASPLAAGLTATQPATAPAAGHRPGSSSLDAVPNGTSGKTGSAADLTAAEPLAPPQAAATLTPSAEGNTAATPEKLVALQLRWTIPELAHEAGRCNGCGHCRTQDPTSRMCPLFRIDPVEDATPRAKANFIRHITLGQLPAEMWSSAEAKRLADLCFNCKQCELECPSNVGISHMMIESKAQYVAEHGLSGADWFLSRAHSFGALGSAASFAVNWALNNPLARWVLEKTVGVSRHRKLPAFARRSFLRQARPEWLQRPKLGGPDKPVIFFVDYFANYHDPELARAFVEILRYHRIPVYIPPEQVDSGMAMISAGDLEAARETALHNLRELADWAREGCAIVCTEPAAALCLKHEYPHLVDHPDVHHVAHQVIEAGAYLKQLHEAGKLKTDFEPLDLDVGYHTPCHLRALQRGTPLLDLLRLIPQLRVHTIDEGCSGMAGAYGLTRDNFASSVRIGWGLISRMRHTDLVAGTTECSSCKLQMTQGTATPTLHPLKLLALAYGLMPDIAKRLHPTRHKLVVF